MSLRFLFVFLICLVGLPGQSQDVDILTYLRSIEGLSVEEQRSAPRGHRLFFLKFKQFTDHENPEKESFEQRLVLLHSSKWAPMVMVTNGYMTQMNGGRNALTAVLQANQLKVEHRYFADSRPASGDWSHLNIKQAATDHHRIVQALKPFYSASWITTGTSKGGMTALYHRRFYPDDVEGTVANVAPLSFGRKDLRYTEFQRVVGAKTCRNSLMKLQRNLLQKRPTVMAEFLSTAKQSGWTFERLDGNVNLAFEALIHELFYGFWQYGLPSQCSSIPAVTEPLGRQINFLMRFGFPIHDRVLKSFEPYFFQAYTQLGYPAGFTDHLKDLLVTDVEDVRPYLSSKQDPPFDYQAMIDIGHWVEAESKNVMLIYGETDPWTAGAFFLENSEARSTHKFTIPQFNHGANISRLSREQRELADKMLRSWTGADIVPQGIDLSPEHYSDDDLLAEKELRGRGPN